ncbi:MAG: prolyl oligopeptidase family serine peptidase [bacterium]|nr:prolyl oligopeptidase family serine peptidase [bacterium]
MRSRTIFITIGALIIMQVLQLFAIQRSHAQLAKIHRKTVVLSVEPSLVVQPGGFDVTVQRFDPNAELTLRLVSGDGASSDEVQVPAGAELFTSRFEPDTNAHGDYVIEVESKTGGGFEIVASISVAYLPDWLDGVRTAIERLEAVEKKGPEDLTRAAWAALAYADEMLELAKTSDAGAASTLSRRLQLLKIMADNLEKGRNTSESATGYQLRGYRDSLGGDIQPYSLYVPKQYDAERQWPLVVMLHGAWSNHHLGLRRVFGLTNRPGEDDAAAKRRMPELPDLPYLVVAPNGYETRLYEGFAEDDVWRVMDEVRAMYNVDPDRVYLTGLSMGGGGTMKLGLRHPDRFAAIAPVCGAVVSDMIDPNVKAEMPAFQKRLINSGSVFPLAENAFELPVYLMHGGADPVVPPRVSIDLNKRLEALGYNTRLDIYPGVDHASWEPGYKDARIFDWFKQFKRDPNPRRVIFRTAASGGDSAYWVSVDDPAKIREFAEIDAQANQGAVVVKTANVDRLSLEFPEALFKKGAPVSVTIDGQEAPSGQGGSKASYALQAGKWVSAAAPEEEPLRPERHGLFEPFWLNHLYAYGSAGSENETKLARDVASLRSKPEPIWDVQWVVKRDDALTEADMAERHLVLVSTLGGSSFLKKHLSEMPFKVTDAGIELAGRTIAPDQGLVLLMPNPANPRKYLLLMVSMTEDGLRGLMKFAATPILFSTWPDGDFVVYGPRGHKLWGGLFDKNWRVSETGDFAMKE